MRSLIILACVLLLSACQSHFYNLDAESDTATLIFSSNNQAVQPMICVPGRGFQDTRHALGRGGSKLLDDLSEALGKRTEVSVPVVAANPTLVAFRFRQGGRGSHRNQCRVTAAFASEAGETYQVRFIRESAHCSILVTQALENQSQLSDKSTSDNAISSNSIYGNVTYGDVTYDASQNLTCP